jgi:hypothetical protein
MYFNEAIIRYGMSDINVYQNKWAGTTGTVNSRHQRTCNELGWCEKGQIQSGL